ncbi:MAG TPA: glycosyltransferase family 39 protein [Terracidiphilus sp.]|nr:glycosyltransferase family 39 protein [Terracidiphilus sp.]
MNDPTQIANRPRTGISRAAAWLILWLIFLAVHFAALFTPPLLDDVDATHAEAAQHMAETGNLVTLYVNGVRYLEKPPLPYWLTAADYRAFGQNVFSTHLPNTLAILGCAWICWLWAGRAWGRRAGYYAALGMLTAFGPFLWTRFTIPDALLSFLLMLALWNFLAGLEDRRATRIYAMWAALALAMLAKGLVAPVFFIAAAIPYLVFSGQWRRWRDLKPLTGVLLFLAISAPWHILAGLANPDQGHAVGNHPTIGNVHGFWYFYFINEHLFRFLGRRYPDDYNKMPFAVYWLAHLVWLFPWSIFVPAVLAAGWKTRRSWLRRLRGGSGQPSGSSGKSSERVEAAGLMEQTQFRVRSAWLLTIYSGFVLVFFSISTNQEYYTFPAWPALLILIAAVLAGIEEQRSPGEQWFSTAWLTGAQAVLAVCGMAIAAALGWGLWVSRHLPYVPDIGTLLAHRDVAGYTLASSHFFDLTGASFAALRMPAVIAAVTLLAGPAVSWWLRLRHRDVASTTALALTSAVFLVAAHIALARFEPMLSSRQLADVIVAQGSPQDSFIIYGDQSDASSVIFYTHNFLRKPADIVMQRCSQHGQGSSLLWGSCWPDAPDIFFSEERLSKAWGTGERKWLFAEDTNQEKVEQLLAGRLYPVKTIADKALWTDRPL